MKSLTESDFDETIKHSKTTAAHYKNRKYNIIRNQPGDASLIGRISASANLDLNNIL